MGAVVLLALALALALALTGLARANEPVQAVRDRLTAAERRYADQDYRGTIDACETVLKDPVAPRDLRARAFEYLGLSWLILAKPPRARAAFEELLAIDPHYTLTDPSRSPKLREFFEEVRAGFLPGYRPAASEVVLEHAAPAGGVAARPLEMVALASHGDAQVADVTLHARRQGLLEFAAAPFRREAGRFVVRYSPPPESSDYVLEYYLEARDARARVVARLASPERPIAIPVKGMPAPWYKRWYVWVVVGAIVAGVVVGAAVAATVARSPAMAPARLSVGFELRF